MPPEPTPTPYPIEAWRDSVSAWMVATDEAVATGLDLARLGIFALVLVGGLTVACLVGIVVLGVRGRG